MELIGLLVVVGIGSSLVVAHRVRVRQPAVEVATVSERPPHPAVRFLRDEGELQDALNRAAHTERAAAASVAARAARYEAQMVTSPEAGRTDRPIPIRSGTRSA
jgi:hypothetical protein